MVGQTITDFPSFFALMKVCTEIGDGLHHHTTISCQINKIIWINIAYSLVIGYYDFYLYCSPTGVAIKRGFIWFELRFVPFSGSSATTPRLSGVPLNYNNKPHFKPFKTTFDTDSGRATIKTKITVPSNEATSYIYSNYFIDLA